MSKPRFATKADNDTLIALAKACPMAGPITMYIDRSPDYFVLSRLQGEGAQVCVIDDEQKNGLLATAAIAHFPHLFIHGKLEQAAYTCDIRILPERRGGALFKDISYFLHEFVVDQYAYKFGFTTIMKGNKAMEALIQGKIKINPPYRYVATMRNYAVLFLFSKNIPKGIEICTASPSHIPDMVNFWNKIQTKKLFAPYWTVEGFKYFLERAPGLKLHNYFLAYRKDRLVGILACWDQRIFKQMFILNYSPQMQSMKRWYNPLASCLGLARMPNPGNCMPYFYATHLAAETPEDLYALYVAVYNANKKGNYFFFDTMLDIRDPLNSALKGFTTKHVDIDLYTVDLHNSWKESQEIAYFDPSLV